MESAAKEKDLRINETNIKYIVLDEEQKRQFRKLEVVVKNGKR